MSKDKFKLNLVAKIVTTDQVPESYKKRALASLAFPETKQENLQYIKAVLVSTGVNANLAEFGALELIKAFHTVPHKAIDIEHKEQELIGHLYDAALIDFEGNLLDYEELKAKADKEGASFDISNFDIVVVGVIYKDRFPDIASEVAAGQWKVSMECWYSDFDLRIGDLVITRSEATMLGYGDIAGKVVRVFDGIKSIGTTTVIRVLKGILFSGMGIVKNPANSRSLILETASESSEDIDLDNPEMDIDISQIEKIRTSVAAEGSEEAAVKSGNKLVVKRWTDRGYTLSRSGDKSFRIEHESPVEYDSSEWSNRIKAAIGAAVGGKTSCVAYVDYEFEDASGMSIEDLLSDSSVRSVYEIDDSGAVISISSVDYYKTVPEIASGPDNPGMRPFVVESYPESICVSFKKYVYGKQGSENPGKIKYKHWCALFDEACPVIGASATSPTCLRNQYRRTIKDPKRATITVTPTEVVDNYSKSSVEPSSNSFKPQVDPDLNAAISKVAESIFKADSVLGLVSETGAKWTRKFINSLPNASFAVIEQDVVKTNKNGRHLPHHDAKGGGTSNVNLDLPHLRNAFARANQINPIGKTSASELRKRAATHLNNHKSALEKARVKGMINDAEWASIQRVLAEVDEN